MGWSPTAVTSEQQRRRDAELALCAQQPVAESARRAALREKPLPRERSKTVAANDKWPVGSVVHCPSRLP